MIILVTGDRNWANEEIIAKALEANSPSLVVEGGARGADRIARMVCTRLGIPFLEIEADWNKYHRAAGPIRNREMLKQGPTLVLAFHNNLTVSKGTKDMCKAAIKVRIPVRLYTESKPDGEYITWEL